MTSRQIKDLIRNQAKKNNIDAQILLRNYMLERLLERISLSKYKWNFILKGGMLVAAMAGLDARSTIDMDATIKGYQLNEENLRNVFDEILHTPVNDDINMTLLGISQIHEESEYECFRISLSEKVENTNIPLKVDITTGEVITPREVQYRFALMLENRSIDILAYNLETVLAEKMETIISRGILNTRMRDFYDLHILRVLQSDNIDRSLLAEAFKATSAKRGLVFTYENILSELDKVLINPEVKRLWGNYRKRFSYAADLEWDEVIVSLKNLFDAILNSKEIK
ncbi:MAG: nucleotidyl transferase AbiEii/AbiGii toxin family protein [Bacteroidales bacterium]|jgi:predicted nucleotidyltransferase component of viral defense system|nr:nucleotidyl transferase AbiEii/AbiGii toxin family protein [Bacteroidales bacterium]